MDNTKALKALKCQGSFKFCCNTFTGSEEAAVSLELAKKLCTRRVLTIQQPVAEDVNFSFSADIQRTGDFTVYLTAKNTSSESRLVDVHVSTLACRYTGIPSSDIKDTSTAAVLEPNKGIA